MKVRRHETRYEVNLYAINDNSKVMDLLRRLLNLWMDEGKIFNWHIEWNHSTYGGWLLVLYTRNAKLKWPFMLEELRKIADLDVEEDTNAPD